MGNDITDPALGTGSVGGQFPLWKSYTNAGPKKPRPADACRWIIVGLVGLLPVGHAVNPTPGAQIVYTTPASQGSVGLGQVP